MNRLICKKILCVGISVLCGMQAPMLCLAQESENVDVLEQVLPAEELWLDDISEWKVGQYSGTSGAYESWPGRICYAQDIPVFAGMVYRLSETDNTYEIVAIQLDASLNVLAKDSYKSGGEISMTEETAFLRLYIYNPSNYNMSMAMYEEAFANGYSLGLSLVEDYSPLLNETNLTNAGLWEKGSYTAKKGEVNTASSVRMKDFKEVEPGETYACHISAANCAVGLVQLDADMNVLGESTLKNGREFTVSEETKYVRLSLTDTVNYNLSVSAYTALCEEGLEFYFEWLEGYSNNIVDANLANTGQWESGLFSSSDGSKCSGGYAIRLIDQKFCSPDTVYEVVVSNPDYRLAVFEYAEDGTFLKLSNLYNGESFVTDSAAVVLGVSLNVPGNYSMSFAKYREAFQTEGFELAFLTEEIVEEEPIEPIEPEEPAEPEVPAEPVEPEVPEEPEEPELPEAVEPQIFVVEDNIIQLSIADDSYRVILEEYDSDMQPVATADLGNLDYHYMDERTEYVSMAMYLFLDGEQVEGTYEVITEENNYLGIELLAANDLTNKSDKEAMFGPELNSASTSNVANYRYGWYKSWGGAYEYSASGVCSRNYYKVTKDSYYVNINDSRIGVSIREYDADGTWLKCVDSMYGGDIYTPSEDAVYVTLTVKSTEWATGPYDLLGYGLVIDFSDTRVEDNTAITELEWFDFTDRTNWRSGTYVRGTGEFGLNKYSICTTQFLSVENVDYPMMVDLWNSYLKMTILELTEDGTVLATSSIHDGQKWTKKAETSYIGISVCYEKNYEYSYYEEQWDAGFANTLERFEKYDYNTVMNPITAEEFMEIMNVGWNLGNSLDSHYGERDEANPALGQERTWGNITITEELIDHIADLGFNTIRIPVTWYYNTYVDENGDLRVHEAWLDRVQDVVDYAIANDMYVFLNTHHEQPIIFTGTEEETFARVLLDAEDLWREIAIYFRDYDEHLIFEAYNEVDNIAQSWSYSATAAEQMNRLNQVFVDTVRATGGNNEYRILCAPTLLDGYNDLILGDYMKPEDPSGEGYLLTQIHTYSYQFDQDIETLFASLENFAEENNLPVIIGEFGTKPSYSPSEYREEATANFVARANAHGLRCIYWDDGNLNNYGLVNRRNFDASEHEILEALIYPQAYRSTNKVTLDTMDSFVYMTLNQSTGELKEDKYWGTIVTDINGYGVEIPAGSDYLTLNLVSTNGATLQKIHYVHFYDDQMNFVSAVNKGNGFQNITLEIPAEAVYVRVGINNSYSATKILTFQKFFWFGEMELGLGFIDADAENSLEPDSMDGTTPVNILHPAQPGNLITLLEDVDVSDFFSYEQGSYYYSTGLKTEDTACIRIADYIEVSEGSDRTYVYTTTKSSVRMSIIQLDSDMKHLGKTELVNNKAITLDDRTKYLAITLSNPYVSYEVDYGTYRQFFEDGMILSFEAQ